MVRVIHLDVNKGTIKEDLAKLPDKMLKASEEALNQAADLIVGLAQVYVRVDTGSLRDSIRKERVAPRYRYHTIVRVRAGGYITNPKTGRKVDYAGIVEMKYPYLRPAVESVLPQLRSLIENGVVEEIER